MEQPKTTRKIAAVAQLITRLAGDGYLEIILDVTGGFAFRDQLKSAGFQFVKDRSAGLGSDTPLTKDGERSTKAVWRRILAAVPPETSPERALAGLDQATQDLDDLLEGVLEGSRVKGAKTSALKLREHYREADGIDAVANKLAALDTPWVAEENEPNVPRPAFAA